MEYYAENRADSHGPHRAKRREIGARGGLCRARRAEGFSSLATAVAQLRVAPYEVLDFSQDGLIFAELSREILIV
jgi:hypothetical protein